MNWKLRGTSALAAVVVLAGGGVVAGVKLGGTAGAIAGAVVGALAGVVAGYVPGIRDKAEQRAAEEATAQARRMAAAEPPLDSEEPGPSVWLRPERAVVEFIGRRDELAQLRVWCESESAKSIRVVAGAGGVGKTRLALQVGAEWQSAGRECLMVTAGKEADAMPAARGVTEGPVLLIVDYAETRANLGSLLRAVLDDPGRVRVLLLARSLGEWWERLTEESSPAVARLVKEAGPIRLAAPITGDVSDSEVAEAAVPFFALNLGVPVPAGVMFELPDERAPVLVLHAAALVAVLRSATGTEAPLRVTAIDGVLAELLEHEARYWRRTANAAGLTTDGRVIKAVVAAAILLGAADTADAALVAGRVPDLAGESVGSLRTWGRWLFGLYPPGPDGIGRLGTIQPDLLAEAYAVAELSADPELAEACLRDIGLHQAERALTVLTRAWNLHPQAGPIITAALRANLAELAIPASAVAIQTSARIGEPLAAALCDAPATLETLIKVEAALPYPSVALAHADATATMRIRRELPPTTEPEDVAKWAHHAGRALHQIGYADEALGATQDAIAIRRELAAAMPERYNPDLARSLSNLGMWFAELGRMADALPPTQEASEIYRELAAAMPDRYNPDLARSLSHLGICFAEGPRPDNALQPAQEAVAIRRELAAVLPDRYNPDLAGSLTNLGNVFARLGRLSDALESAQDAVAIYRKLAAIAPDRYKPDLAASLANLGIRFWELGTPAYALAPTQEAVAIYRELAAALPDRYRPSLAAFLTDLGVWFAALGQPDDALPPTQEAVAIRRGLAAAAPKRYNPGLATSLTHLGAWFAAVGQPDDALPPTQEAVAIYRELTAAMPDRYNPELAASLANLGSVFAALGRGKEAAAARAEADGLRGE